MTFNTGLHRTDKPATIHPKIERTPKGELIVVFKDGTWLYHYEWLLTASKEHMERMKRLTQPNT
jgi:hypothetical protein